MSAAWLFIKGIPREIWYVLGLIGLLAGLWFWHADKVSDAYTAGAVAQKAIDRAAFTKAEAKAEKAQDKKIDDLKTQQNIINEGNTNDLAKAHSDIDRLAAQLRLRHQARTNKGVPGRGEAASVPGTTGSVDDATCSAAGWLSFDSALVMATDAEHDAAQLRAAQEWILAQQKAWPE